MILLDFWLIDLSSSGDSFPAPGMSLSIKYLGISSFPHLPGVCASTYHRYATIHTVSTSVKPRDLSPAELRVAQGAQTRAKLMGVACELFGKKGFQETSL